jgi:hypothetical protein
LLRSTFAVSSVLAGAGLVARPIMMKFNIRL